MESHKCVISVITMCSWLVGKPKKLIALTFSLQRNFNIFEQTSKVYLANLLAESRKYSRGKVYKGNVCLAPMSEPQMRQGVYEKHNRQSVISAPNKAIKIAYFGLVYATFIGRNQNAQIEYVFVSANTYQKQLTQKSSRDLHR